MCGISGILSPEPIDPRWLQAMTAPVRHRGPDDEGYVLFADTAYAFAGSDTPAVVKNSSAPYAPKAGILEQTHVRSHLGFGHRRLSIVDLTPQGHQPMSYVDRYWITYNGEIYNHTELRAVLQAQGCRFNSQSDTEIILAAYHTWGMDCLSRFNGMWAFALYDTETKTLVLARDRFGVKPLYYWVSPSGALAFGSEIKQFTVLPDWRAQVNGQRVYDFLVWSVLDHTDETLFTGVRQINPGHCTQIRIADWNKASATKTLPTRAWYKLTAKPFAGSLTEAAAEFRSKFEDSIRLRLRADVPVGSCLSGGLDSSSIVCTMNQLLVANGSQAMQKTFSACSDVALYDEQKWINEVVGATKVEAHYVHPSLERLFDESETITWYQDEPFGSTSIYAQWNVFRLASQSGVKVMLDGQGSDEQLAGYHSYFGPHLATLIKTFRWFALVEEIAAIRGLHNSHPKVLIKQAAHHLLPPWLVQLAARSIGRSPFDTSWLDTARLGAEPCDPFAATGARRGSVTGLSLSQLTASNLPMLLHWEDRDSMAHSIESRVPFLDYRLVEFVLGLPDDFKLWRGVTKRVLREAMHGVLPETVRQRSDKLGFATPEEVWLRERAPGVFRAKLERSIAASQGILKRECRQVLDDMIAGRRQFSFLAWRMINFGEWMSRFDVKI